MTYFRATITGLLLCCSLQAALPETEKLQLDEHISAALAAFNAPSVSVAVVEDGKLAYANAFGKANVEHNQAATVDTRYAVGSISKQFTAAALLLAQEKGLLSIDDKVAKYFPQLTRANEVTIRELLSHTSGYEDYAPQDYIIPMWTKPTTAQATMAGWAKKPLNFDPGTKWQYSNTNYVIAGAILEKVTGQKLVAFLQEHIFGPLDMKSAGDWIRPGGLDADAYTRYALGPARPVAREGDGWYFAAAELSMTPSDLAKWDIALLQNRILSPASYQEFTHEAKLKDGSGTHYALGLALGESGGKKTLSHSGEVSGFLASNVIFPDANQAIIVLSNEDGVNMIGGVSHDIAAVLQAGVNKRDEQVKAILLDLQQGKIDRSAFTSDANSYFGSTALADYQKSLTPLGKLVQLSLQNEQLRGGMKHLSYRAHFERNTVNLNVYLQFDGKFEQFLVEEQF
jgi:CubicO group peptidase (beta-lactamase class C family)